MIWHEMLAQVTAFCRHQGWMVYCAFYDYAAHVTEIEFLRTTGEGKL
jgi:hypothetical protein